MEMNDEIAAPQPASPAHFWRFYRRLKPAPPLYPRSGHLTVRYRAHIPADEEDPSYNAIFDNTRFVYPIQKTVAQPTRLPTTTSFRPLKESKASLVILAVDQAEKSRVRQGRASPVPVAATPAVKGNKYAKPVVLKNHLQEHVNQLQHRGVPISKNRVRVLEFYLQKKARMKQYEVSVTENNKESAVKHKKVCEARVATLLQSVENARAVCMQSAVDQLTVMKRYGHKNGEQNSNDIDQGTRKRPVEIAVEALP